jgi:hypothetical protein
MSPLQPPTERPLHPEERAALEWERDHGFETLIAGRPSRRFVITSAAVLLAALIVLTAFILLLVLDLPVMETHPVVFGIVVGPVTGIALVAGTVSAFLLVIAWSWRIQVREAKQWFYTQRRPELEALLNDGRVRSYDFVAQTGVKFEEFEDEGDLYVIALAGGACLLLEGQCVGPFYPDNTLWSGRHFRLVECVANGELLGIFGDGSEVPFKRFPRDTAVDTLPLGQQLPLTYPPFEARYTEETLDNCLIQLRRQSSIPANHRQ